MTLTDAAILLFIALLLIFAIYDQWIMPRRCGKTRLRVALQRRSKIDSLIFIGLIMILIYNNITRHGPVITTTLLMALILVTIYLFWIRTPQLLLKDRGFFFANVWINYDRIKGMNLSEDGVLVIQLEQRKLLVRVKQLDDLERIYETMIENQ
ncbi:DUF986 family protein [Mixta tenebrionis]|uniref:UPF0266 membrane protein FKM52_06310 n=1 Tax=Mixta tenebrionis TaxID=2562439 RepID=A0A506VCX8_9GAMM|nr:MULTISPECIES: DUF986 family protein [Mixta]QHM75277.1 hypothetical protein C7M52_01228 [Mixta theicola]TPW43408.1 DUF986 domain-containing protein [Mixta tenebrionis]